MLYLLIGAIGPALAASITVRPGDDLSTLLGSLGPGDVVTFEDGVYSLPQGLVLSPRGEEGAPVLLVAADGAEPTLHLQERAEPILLLDDAVWTQVRGLSFVGDGPEGAVQGLRLAGGLDTRVTIADCHFRSLGGPAVRVTSNAQFIELSRLYVHDLAGPAVDLGCSDARCWTQDSTIADLFVHDVTAEVPAIRLRRGTHNVTIRDTVIVRAAGDGVLVDSTEFNRPNVLDGNAVWEVGANGLNLQGATTVRNTVIARTGGAGIFVGDPGRDTLESVTLAFNTIVETTAPGIWLTDAAERDGIAVLGNAVSNPVGRALIAEPPLDRQARVRGNVFAGLVDGVPSSQFPGGYREGYGSRDFVDVAALDLYPSAESRLLEAGPVDDAPPVDYNGVYRSSDTPDAGAFEWDGVANPSGPLAEDFKHPEAAEDVPIDTGGCLRGDAPDDTLAVAFAALPFAWGRRRRRAPPRGRP